MFYVWIRKLRIKGIAFFTIKNTYLLNFLRKINSVASPRGINDAPLRIEREEKLAEHVA